ncbi:MAG: NifB/NifX family molybdenum-iron cluster-binding protein [Thermodesulfobacteriota bacterium]|nr:NifB/NifX family molybdenum-iron cluster-binding protein [Thermodesulfobacteriota bacterium]
MKIAITAAGPALDDMVEARFGRCPYFQVIDTETMEHEALENSNIALGGGAGIQSAQMMSDKGVKVVLTGNCGPNAFQVFNAAGVQVIVGVSGKVRDVVEQFKTGGLSNTSGPNVASHFGMGQGVSSSGMGMGRGMGQGMGRGMGQGMGRGMGQGMGRGMGMPGGNIPLDSGFSQGKLSKEETIESLKKRAQDLEDQKAQLEKQIKDVQESKASGVVAEVDAGMCSGCGICVDACPVGAITMNDVAIVNKEICNGCGICEQECPVDAITMG